MQMNPAKSIIDRLGGATAVAAITGRHVSRVYRWMLPKAEGGTDGVIPHAEAVKILRHSREQQIGIVPDDFFVDPSPVALAS